MEDCCAEHARSEESGRVLKELWQMRRGIKTFPVTRKIRNVLLVDLLAILEAGADLQKAKMILKDGVHVGAQDLGYTYAYMMYSYGVE